MAVNIGPRIGIEGESEYRKSIQNIIQQQKTLKSEMEKTASAWDKSTSAEKKAKEAKEVLNKQIEVQKKRVEELTKMLEESAKKYGENDTRTLSWKEAVNKATAELNGLKAELGEVPSKLDIVGKSLEDCGQKISNVGNNISGLGKDLTAKVTLPLVAIGTAGAKSFADVDKTMQLTNATMGNTEAQARLLSDAMKDAAANSVYGMSDAATATLNFARAGLDAEQAAAALAPAMNLAAGEGGNLDTVSAGLVATINGFAGSFDDASHYADVFANACNNSALDVDGLSSAMSVAAPIFSAAGYAVEDAALYMGIMANNGIDADKAANSLKTGLARLVAPAKEGSDMMELLGISVTNADGSMKDSITIQQELHDSFSKLSESEQIAAASAIFGKNQMAPWLALINTAPTDVNNLSTALETQGTTTDMATAMMSGFGGSIEKLKSSIDVASTSIGEALAPAILKVSDNIQLLMDKFNALDPSTQQTITTIGLVVAAVGPLLLIIGKVITTVGTIVTAVGKLLPLVKAAGAAIAGVSAPVAIAIAAGASLVAIGVALYKNWDTVKAKAKEFAANVSEKWTGLTNEIKKNVELSIQDLKNAKDKIVQGWENLKAKVVQLMETIKTNVTNAWNNLKTSISTAVNNIKTSVSTAWENIKTKITTLMDSIKTKVLNVWDNLKTSIGTKIDNIKSTVTTKFESIRDKIKETIEKARDIVKDAIEKIKGFFKFDWEFPKLKLPHISYTLVDVPVLGKIPDPTSLHVEWYKKAMQNGMILNSPTIFGASNGHLLGAGEAGPEVVVGASSLYRMIQGAVGNTYNNGGNNVYVYGAPGQDVRELAKEIADILDGNIYQEQAVFA
jgi:TP901 family phage tail tape measure protein